MCEVQILLPREYILINFKLFEETKNSADKVKNKDKNSENNG